MTPIGLEEAWELVRHHTKPMDSEEVSLHDATGRILSACVYAKVDSPSADVSLKDGYAVRSIDTAQASQLRPARLRVVGSRFAGERRETKTPPGACVQIMSGAILPDDADAVVAIEHCTKTPEGIQIPETVSPGLNVLVRGTDIEAATALGEPGDWLGPAMVGWLAAAGLERVPVVRRPQVSMVATGDEVVAPGVPLQPGQLYASNLVTLSAWLRAFGIEASMEVVPDRREKIERGLSRALEGKDVMLTSGGAWGSERDLVVDVLEGLGWQRLFHRVRIGPGKAVGCGLLAGRPVFCLPGGPPSNEIAFLQLALPGILRMAGSRRPPFPSLNARLTEPVQGREINWTQFKRGKLSQGRDGLFRVTPYRPRSRLESMALADCLIAVPEGVERLETGEWVSVQVLTQLPDGPAAGP